jgi:hypothetical protein
MQKAPGGPAAATGATKAASPANRTEVSAAPVAARRNDEVRVVTVYGLRSAADPRHGAPEVDPDRTVGTRNTTGTAPAPVAGHGPTIIVRERGRNRRPLRRPWNAKDDRGAVPGAPASHFRAGDPRGFGQVGCIYTAQGFEYDWSGVIFGDDFVRRGQDMCR